MNMTLALIAVIGAAIQGAFISNELKEKMGIATILKGLASLFFCAFGIVCYAESPSDFGRLIVYGLILGMIGDILLNLRYNVSQDKSMKVFAVGVLAFLSGHFFYIAALISAHTSIVLMSIIVAAVLSVICIPPLIRRITAPSKGLLIFGHVYLVIVIAMFSCALITAILVGTDSRSIAFLIGALLFVVSDFIMIYYSFGTKLPALRVANLSAYYLAQLVIAYCILL